ncbi:MAG: hypothetical protein Tsb0013_02910 [Phycisphaerales bacterium]
MNPRPSVQISHGMNLKDGLALARTMGCWVAPRRRTGEIQIVDPASRKRVLVNGRRKDAPRALTQFLKAMARIA